MPADDLRTKPGPKPAPQDQVHRATMDLLEEMTTIDGMPYDDWLMKLTPEKVEKLQRPPTKNRRLSLDTWKRTTQGWAVFQREGQKPFEDWATHQTEKLKTWKGLQMQELLGYVESRIGRKRKSRKGTFFQYVQEAKDKFLMRWGLSWEEMSPSLRHKRQPGFRGDCDAFYQRQEDYINNRGVDISFETLRASTPVT